MFATDDSNFLNFEDRVQNCSYPQYLLLINEDKSDVLNASSMDIKSNEEMYLDGNVLIGLNDGKIKADSATFLQKHSSIKDIKKGLKKRALLLLITISKLLILSTSSIIRCALSSSPGTSRIVSQSLDSCIPCHPPCSFLSCFTFFITWFNIKCSSAKFS